MVRGFYLCLEYFEQEERKKKTDKFMVSRSPVMLMYLT